MYTYQLQRKKEEKKNTKYTVIDKIKENEVPKVPENQEQHQVPQTLIDPLSDSLIHFIILMVDSSEPECYEEAMQVETRKKWEQDMDEEMDSMVRKKNWDLV